MDKHPQITSWLNSIRLAYQKDIVLTNQFKKK